MRKKLLSLLALTLCMASSTWALDPMDGVYQIGSAQDLVDFATLVNGGTTGANAVLTANIDLNGVTWTPIGFGKTYTGTFDGDGKTITGFSLSTTGDSSGLFGTLGSGAVIKNFTIVGSITSNNHQYVGVIGAASGDITISNIHSKVNITCSKSRHGGILGAQTNPGTINIDRCTYSGKLTINGNVTGNFGGIMGLTNNNTTAYVNITNCLFDGEIDDGTGDNAGGIVGYTNRTKVTIKNCLSKGIITAAKPGQFFGQLNASNSKWDGKNYYVEGNVIGNLGSGVTVAGTAPETTTAAQLASGEICYALNGGTETDWYQTKGTNTYPVPFDTSKRIYKNLADEYVNIDSPLQIGSATDLKNFAAIVNNGGFDLDAELTDNIDLATLITADGGWTPIGYWTPKLNNLNVVYKGHFNGNNYAITGLTFSTKQDYNGLFGVISDNSLIENFTVRGTITNDTKNTIAPIAFARDNNATIQNITSYVDINSVSGKRVGGVLGTAHNGTVKVDRCFYGGTITVTDSNNSEGNYGGIVGYVNNATSAITNITNCLFDGEISGDGTAICGGIIGYIGANPVATIKNCLSIGTISGPEIGMIGGRVQGTSVVYTNNFYKNGSVNANGSNSRGDLVATTVTTEQLASGEICYLLNGDQSDIAFYQAVGTDDEPTLDATHGQVYVNGTVCPDTNAPQGTVSYSNSEGTNVGSHVPVDGFCTYCGTLDETYMTPISGYYEIGIPAQLKWFAAYVNAGHPAVNAKLVANIDLTGITMQSIGNASVAYSGEFDGQENVISGFEATSMGKGGFFGNTNSATIRDFSIGGALTATGGTGSGVVGWATSCTISSIHSTLTISVPNDDVHHVGGVVGSAQGNNTISCCSFNGSLTLTGTSGDNFAGITAYITTGDNVTNCANYGTITFAGTGCRAGGVVGYNNSTASIKNCLNTGIVTCSGGTPTYGGAIVGRQRSTVDATKISNNYWLGTSADKASGDNELSTSAESVTTEQLASGEVAYKLGAAFYQTIKTDTYPVLDSNSEKVLYVGAAGYSTMYDADNDWELIGDAKAYIGTLNGSSLHLEEIDDIPAGTAVVIGGTYYNKVSTTATADTDGNVLLGSDGNVQGGSNIYALAKKGDNVGFYPVGSGVTIPAGKAYLNTSAGVKGFTFVFDDDATGIENLNVNDNLNEGAIYNLAGQRLGKMQKGINIVNGKKILK